jgi:3-oxoadipate enol-lactonase
MFIDANGIKMHYVMDGNPNKPWLTMVTGITNDTTMWDGQIDVLKEDFHILRYDLRGQGKTQATPSPYTIDLLSRDLIALWDALGIQKSHLMGLGLGASISLAIGIHYPERILSLVPCCCRAKMAPDFASMWLQLRDLVKLGGIEKIVENTAQRWFSESFKQQFPEKLDAVRAMIRGTSQDGYLGVVSAFIGLDLENDLGKINVPTLLMGGEEDKVGGPRHVMLSIAERIPNAVYTPVPGAAHIANLQNPEGFNQILKSFLLSVANRT